MAGTLPTRARAQASPAWRTLWFVIFVVVAGAIGGAAWAVFAHRPGYVITNELGAYLTERGQADVFSSDALFVAMAGLVGMLTGVVAWLRFRDLGWLVCLHALLGGIAGAVIVWRLGLLVSPNNFDQRLAAAAAGDTVPIDLALHSLSALLIGPFGAITPIMLCAAFWPDGESSAQQAPEARRVATLD
ncbi:MAG: hypothetical protein Q4D96_00475 [Propionibacteriaceae bacterium]|nr:hypothetical protein [Propionibacteriaceae bacterium]